MFRASLAGYQELLQIEDLPAPRSCLSLVTGNLADIAAARGQFDAAVALHRQAIDLLQPLLATDDDAATYRGRLVERLSSLGSCLRRAGRLQAADEELARARELAGTCATDSTAWQRRLARLEWKSADLAQQRGLVEIAEARHEAALQRYEQLATAARDVWSWSSLARLCSQVAQQRSLANDHEGAAQLCQRARELWSALLELGDSRVTRGELCDAMALHGTVLACAGEPEPAERLLLEALAGGAGAGRGGR